MTHACLFTAKANVAFSHVACSDPNCRAQTESAQLDAKEWLHSDRGGRGHNSADCRAARNNVRAQHQEQPGVGLKPVWKPGSSRLCSRHRAMSLADPSLR